MHVIDVACLVCVGFPTNAARCQLVAASCCLLSW